MGDARARILVVDDSPVYRRILSEVVAGMPDVELAGAADGGAAALEVARRGGCDVVLLDLQMPGMNGLETLAALREIDPEIAVVLMSGRASAASDAAVRAAELGVSDFIPKPNGTTVAENVAALTAAFAPVVWAIQRRRGGGGGPVGELPAVAALRRRMSDRPAPAGVASGPAVHPSLRAPAPTVRGTVPPGGRVAPAPRPTAAPRGPEPAGPSLRPVAGATAPPGRSAVPARLNAAPPRVTAAPPPAAEVAAPEAPPRRPDRGPPGAPPRGAEARRAPAPALARREGEARGRGAPGARPAARPTRAEPRAFDLMVIGTSTGGPEALMTLIPSLPASLPVPVAVVQHMPPVFTATLAARLDQQSPLAVREAAEGDLLAPGLILVAPGGRHLRLAGRPGRLVARLDDGPRVNDVRPAVDVLLQSIADIPGVQVLSVILTGMGGDGTEGLRLLGRDRSYTLVQDAATCAVYGMPARVAEAGLADETLPLGRLSARLAQIARARRVA